MKNYNILVSRTINEIELFHIITTAFEGGINHWACLNNSHEFFKQEQEVHKDYSIVGIILNLLVNNKFIELFDTESEYGYDDVRTDKFILTIEKMIEGIKKFLNEYGFDTDLELLDSIDCDIIIQYALFGEVVYG